MSITHSIFAERRKSASWKAIGEPYYLEAWDCFHPPQAFDISPRDDLITVLNGYLTRPWGIEHTGLEVIAEPRGLPDDLSPELREWADRVVEPNTGQLRTMFGTSLEGSSIEAPLEGSVVGTNAARMAMGRAILT